MKLRSLFDRTLWKFLLVGVANTLVGNGLMFLLYNLADFGYWSATALSYALASVMSYFLNKYFTFKMKDADGHTALRFALNIAVCYLLAYGLAKPLVSGLLSGYGEKVRGNVAMLVGMCLFTGLNYLGQRFFAFRKPARFAKRLDKQGKLSLSLSFFLPVIVMLVVCAAHGIWPFGDKQVLAHDMWHQYYPFFVDFRRMLTEGGSMLYSRTSGLGTNYLALYAYYLASPLNLLSAIVPEGMLLDFYTVLLLTKIGLCGLTFALFLKLTFRRSDLSIVPFSVAFALCSFLMGYYWNIMWLDTVAMLPLVMAGAIALLREGRWRLYVFSLALTMWCNYYIGFFVCIAVALLFLGHTICYWDNFHGFFRRLWRLALCSVLGVGMAAVLLLPVYLGLQNTYSAINAFPRGLSLNIATEKTLTGILDAFRQIFAGQMACTVPTAMSGLPNIYCGVAAVFLAGVFCFSGKFRLRERIGSCLLLLFFAASFIFRQLDYVWHGFHFPNMLPYRFSFLYSFVVLTMAYRAWSVMEHLKWYHALAGLLAVVCVLVCGIPEKNVASLVTTAVIGVTVFIVALTYKKMPRWLGNCLLLVICVIEGATCAGFGMDEAGVSSRTGYPKLYSDTKAVLAQTDQSHTDWYRTELTNYQCLNDPALLGYHGATIFSSTTNKAASDFLVDLGLSSWPASNRYAYMESSPFTNLMLNIRYLVDREGNHLDPDYNKIVAQSGDVTLQENASYLPMGFVMRPEILEFDTQQCTDYPMNTQNKLFTMATGVEEALYTTIPPTTMDGGEASVRENGRNKYSYQATGLTADPELTFTYVLSEDTLFCVYFQCKGIQNLRISVNDAYLADRNVKVGSILCLGDYPRGTKITLRCTGEAGKTNRISLQACSFHKDVFNRGYQILSQSKLRSTQLTERALSGVIRVQEPGLFYTSIPYEPGWTAKVDGKPVDITPVGGAMLAFSIDGGTHTVEISYLTPGLLLGAGISAFCLLAVLLLLIFHPKFRMPKRPKRQPEPDAQLEFLLNYEIPELQAIPNAEASDETTE